MSKGEQDSQIHSGLNLQEPGLSFSTDVLQGTKAHVRQTRPVRYKNTRKAAACIRRAREGDGSVLFLGSQHPKTFHSLLVMLVLELVMRHLSLKV